MSVGALGFTNGFELILKLIKIKKKLNMRNKHLEECMMMESQESAYDVREENKLTFMSSLKDKKKKRVNFACWHLKATNTFF